MTFTNRRARSLGVALGLALGATLLLSPAAPRGGGGADAAVGPRRPTIVVYKAERQLLYFENDILKRRFPIVLGRKPQGKKERRGDHRTPEGEYYVTSKTSRSRFFRFLGLSYPNIEDAQRGLLSHLIDRGQYLRIKEAINHGDTPPWGTALGGYIGIHGEGEYSGFTRRHRIDWTEGCISISDDDMRTLYGSVGVGTPVLIFP
jgi:murein L,D-transpeptidase YafK